MSDLLERIRDPVFQALVGAGASLIIVGGAYALGSYSGIWVPFYFSLIIGLVLLFPALLLLTVVFLLWNNPEKYKEREMKRWRRLRGTPLQKSPTTEEALKEEVTNDE